MKKILSFAAFCALLVSCGGNNAETTIQNFPEQKVAGKTEFVENQEPELPLQDYETNIIVTSIEHMGNGTYLAEGYETAKALHRIVVTGRFSSEIDGSTTTIKYLTGPLAGITLVKENSSYHFTYSGGDVTAPGTFTPTPTPTDPVLAALCGARWKFSYIEAKVPSHNVSLSFNADSPNSINPNDVEKIAQYINEKAESEVIPMKSVSGYYVKSISLSPAEPDYTICVEFENGKEPVKGSWTPTIKEKTFEYHLDQELDGKLFEADANGTFDFENNYNTLVLKMTAKAEAEVADIIIKAKKIQ